MYYTAFSNGLRSFFSTVDRAVYSLIGTLYDIIVNLANFTLIEDTSIAETSVSDITNKLYSFIGIFMLFRITFSLITYIINPDGITDKEKGGTKLITNIVLTFGLVIFCPFGFTILRSAQSAILEENILTKIVFDNGTGTGNHQLYISSKCEELGKNPVTPFSGFRDDLTAIDSTGEYIAMATIRPFVQLSSEVQNNSEIETFINSSGYCNASTIKELLKDSTINEYSKGEDKPYFVDYNIFISTVIGIIILLIFAGFCLDAAVRTIKLTFLETIAPIPIISYIDPSSAKKGLFVKWLKEVGVTWADLFLRLIAVYFSVFLITSIDLNSFGDIKITVIFILGALMFAKKLPDILKKLFNIDLKGDFTLNPFKKIEKEALGGKLVAGAATGLAAAGIGAATSFRGADIKERFKNAGKGFTTGLSGGFKSPNTLKGLGTGMQPYKEIRKKQKEADQQLKEFDDFNRTGKKLTAAALERNPDGSYKLDENGKLKTDPTKLFKNQEYIDSYKKVQNAKDKLKTAKENSKVANSELQRITSGNLTKEEQAAIDSGAITYSALKEKATAAAFKADSAVEKAQSVLDGAKERHKIVQSKYTSDAQKEKAMKEYTDRNASALDPNSSHNVLDGATVNINRANVNSNNTPNGGPTPPEQGDNANHVDRSQMESASAQQFAQRGNDLDHEIAQKEAERDAKEKQRRETTDEDEREKLGSELSNIGVELQLLKEDREHLNEEYPEEAADYIENVVMDRKNKEKEKLEKEREALYNTFSSPQEAEKNYGRDYVTNEKYQKAKTLADLKEMAIKDIESEQRSLKQKAKDLRSTAEDRRRESTIETATSQSQEDSDSVESLFENAPSHEQSDRSKHKEQLEEELKNLREEESKIKRRYGVPNYTKVKEYQEIQEDIRKIEDELYYL